MLKDERLRDSQLALKRHVTLTAAEAYQMGVGNELVSIALPVGATNFDVTLPNVSEARQDVDYMVRILSQGGTGVVSVKSGADSWNAIDIDLDDADQFVVARSNGFAWYVVDSVIPAGGE
jgi:hypothetical protein